MLPSLFTAAIDHSPGFFQLSLGDFSSRGWTSARSLVLKQPVLASAKAFGTCCWAWMIMDVLSFAMKTKAQCSKLRDRAPSFQSVKLERLKLFESLWVSHGEPFLLNTLMFCREDLCGAALLISCSRCRDRFCGNSTTALALHLGCVSAGSVNSLGYQN